MTNTVKITKAMVLTAIERIMQEMIPGETTVEVDGATVTMNDIVNYCNTTLTQLEAKADKAKERAAKTKAAGDEMRAAVLACVTDEFQTADAITAQVEFEDVTKSKVVARLTQLVKAGEIIKESQKLDGGTKMCYRLAD